MRTRVYVQLGSSKVLVVYIGAIGVRCYSYPDLTTHTQVGAFLPRLLEQTKLLESSDEILDLNVILVYKKLVQGLIYSPPDCDKHLALDAKLQV